MPSVVEVTLYHGMRSFTYPSQGTPVYDISVLYFRWADNNLPDNTDPIIPGAGTVYSWAKTVNLWFTTPPDNEATNLRFFSTAADFGGDWAGVSMVSGIDLEGLYFEGNSSDQSAAHAGFANHLVDDPLLLDLYGAQPIFDSNDDVPGPARAYNAVMQLAVVRSVPAGQTDPQIQYYRYSES